MRPFERLIFLLRLIFFLLLLQFWVVGETLFVIRGIQNYVKAHLLYFMKCFFFLQQLSSSVIVSKMILNVPCSKLMQCLAILVASVVK